MHKSKLQISVEILCSLSSKGPMKLAQISDEVELSKSMLMEYLEFLYERGLVGENNPGDEEKTYFVTDKGLSVIKVMVPIIKAAQRIEIHNLKRISNALSGTKFKPRKTEEKKPIRKRLQDFIKIELLQTEE